MTEFKFENAQVEIIIEFCSRNSTCDYYRARVWDKENAVNIDSFSQGFNGYTIGEIWYKILLKAAERASSHGQEEVCAAIDEIITNETGWIDDDDSLYGEAWYENPIESRDWGCSM